MSNDTEKDIKNFLDDEDKKFIDTESIKSDDSNDDESLDLNAPTLEELHKSNIDQRFAKNDDGRIVYKESADSEIHGANDSGWKTVPVEFLPSKGMFYPMDTELTIRSATVAEIRQWSTIDDGDYLDQDDTLNFIIEKCTRLKSSNGVMSWKDIKEIDRFFIIFRIHELTFPNGENKLMVKYTCTPNCGYSANIQLTSSHLHMVEFTDMIMKLYDYDKRCFFKHSEILNEDISIYIPSLGTMGHIKKILRDSRKNGSNIDRSFIRLAPFFVSDWRNIRPDSFEKLRHSTYQWHQKKFLFISGFIDEFKSGIKTVTKHQCERCGEILEQDIFFRGGYSLKDLFSVSSGFDDIV